jgi:hypothetical protein
LLLAGIDNCNQIELVHWARGQAFTERLRIGVHELYHQINDSDASLQRMAEDRVYNCISEKKNPTRREIHQFTNLGYSEIDPIIEKLNTP